ncbi:MAG: hypothetical protein R2883_05585 [Caldisericia bacterium]
MEFENKNVNFVLGNTGWISIGLGLASILLRHLLKIVPFISIITLIIAGIGLLFGVFGLADKEKRSLSIAGIATCIIAGIIHFGSIWLLLLLLISAYFVFFRKPSKKQENPNEIYENQDGRYLDN